MSEGAAAAPQLAGLETLEEAAEAPRPRGAVVRFASRVNGLIVVLGGLAFLAASLILSYSVLARYWLKIATDWQDETAIFLLVGAVFLSGGAVQARRGHVAIDAVASLLPEAANRWRLLLCDLVSFLFCAFFAWKSWSLLHEAWVDGQTSNSTWGPPLWIPYVLMAAGMTLLAAQILLQLIEGLRPEPHAETRSSASRTK